MKQLYLLIALAFPGMISAQVATQNYIRTCKMLNVDGSSYIEQIMYYDGLGRPFETVQKGITPSKQNLTSLQEYDESGRPTRNWLPILSTSDYLAPSSFKSSAPGNYGNDSRPFREPIYESSPLDRITQQYDPGAAWYSSHPVTTEYLTNTADSPLHCINYTVSSTGALIKNGNFSPTQLYVTKVTDEDKNINYYFTDKLNRIVLTRQITGSLTHDTYYVFDDYGNLCFVLQPMYQENANLDLYAFQYKYDSFNRCEEKKQPGAQVVKYVYDMYNNLVFSQDGNQRPLGQWTFYLYDNFRRLTVSGVCLNTNTASASSVQVKCTRVNSNSGLGNSGYTSSFSLNTPTVHMVNYYDDYNFRSLTGFTNITHFPSTTVIAKGFLTGSVMTLIENGTKIYSATYYDKEARVVKTVSGNHMGGYETTNTTYTFAGKPLTVQHIHSATGKSNLTETYTYSYDHAERITKVQHNLNGSNVTLAANTYDNFSRLYTKSLHGSTSSTLNYTYNLRSWLTSITATKFTQNLYYTDGNNNIKCYNGNISSMTWKAGDETTVRGYKFSYDGLSRLANAAYGETAAINTNLDRFTEKVSSYDKNGNITALQRYGQTTASAYGLIDNLTFTLNGNQLNRVDDAVTTSAYNGGFEFKDAVKQAGEYAYDANGNLTKDLNKGISSIQYNILNLPSSITFSDGSTITYTHSADGTKLRTVHKIGATTTTTDYCSNVIYENDIAKQLLTEEGYVSLSYNKYHYYLKDHQGNNRVVVNQTGTVEETNHYYPFGGVFAGTGNVQPYKYNGKEYDAKKGLNWYDYGARQYDATLGRFTTVDPLGEKYYSTGVYGYCVNNPIRFIDPTGKLVSPIYDEKGKLLGTDDEGLKGKAIIMNESNFKQGMSHEEALNHSLGYDGLVNDAARSNYVTSYTGLKDRPDYDGYLTMSEANKWYKEGNGQPLFTSLEKIDLSGIYSLGEKYVGQIKSFNLLLHSGSLNDGLVYGNITLKRYPNHSVRAFSDKYDFEMHNTKNPLNWGRNAETIIGRKVAGEGQSYEINIYGNKQLVPFLPWIK